MKKIILAISLLVLFACNKEDDAVLVAPDNTKHLLLEQMKGRYSLAQLYTDVPIDVNLDGEYHTDMLVEIDCISIFPFGLFRTTVQYYPSGGGKYLGVELVHSDEYTAAAPGEQCLFPSTYSYSFDIDPATGIIDMTYRFEERETKYGPLTAARYEDGTLYFEYDKIFFTSEGWQTVKLYVVYVKNDER